MLRRLLLLGMLPCCGWCEEPAIKPSATIRLFDGKTLDNFDLWQQDNHEQDPDKVFSVVDQVDGAPAIRISGQHWGGLITKSAYRDYRLVAEFRWGLPSLITISNRYSIQSMFACVPMVRRSVPPMLCSRTLEIGMCGKASRMGARRDGRREAASSPRCQCQTALPGAPRGVLRDRDPERLVKSAS